MERISSLATYSLHIIYNQVHERNKSDNLEFLENQRFKKIRD